MKKRREAYVFFSPFFCVIFCLFFQCLFNALIIFFKIFQRLFDIAVFEGFDYQFVKNLSFLKPSL